MQTPVLEGRHYVPVACIRSEFDKVSLAFRDQLLEWGLVYIFNSMPCTIDDIRIGELAHGGAHAMKVGLLDHGTHVTMLTNYRDGWSSMLICLSRSLDCDAFMFTMSDEQPPRYPLNCFHYIKGGKITRAVAVSYDQKWTFATSGEPLAEEDTSNYTKRLLRERMTAMDVASLADRLGFCIGDIRGYQCDNGLLATQQR